MDRRKFVSYKTATDFRTKFLDRIEELNIDFHIIIGNHDTYYKNTSEVNSMHELVGDRFKVYTCPEVVEFDGFPIPAKAIIFLSLNLFIFINLKFE